jgi:hypothetical protein
LHDSQIVEPWCRFLLAGGGGDLNPENIADDLEDLRVTDQGRRHGTNDQVIRTGTTNGAGPVEGRTIEQPASSALSL